MITCNHARISVTRNASDSLRVRTRVDTCESKKSAWHARGHGFGAPYLPVPPLTESSQFVIILVPMMRQKESASLRLCGHSRKGSLGRQPSIISLIFLQRETAPRREIVKRAG